jgi:hypothetical protein
MTLERLIDDQWPYVGTLLPEDLDESARRHGALVRRRGMPNAESLVRTLLAYGLTDLSLQSVAAWARSIEVANLSTQALFYRVRDAETWLASLLTDLLSQEVSPPRRKGLRLRVVDATVVVGPGAVGPEWRLHTECDPATGRLCAVEITDKRGGEGMARFNLQEGDVVLGDRGYAYSQSIAAAVRTGARVLVRFNPQTLRLCTDDHERFDFVTRAKKLHKTGPGSWSLLMPTFPPRPKTKSKKTWPLSNATDWIPVRVVAARTRTRSIIWLVTTLRPEEATDVEVVDLYRLRWQIELLFKRLKSLLRLDAMPSREGPTAKSWLLARLLGAALAQKLLDPNEVLSPWGYELR